MAQKINRKDGHVFAGSEIAARRQVVARLEGEIRDARDGMRAAERFVRSQLNWAQLGGNDGERDGRLYGVLEGHLEPDEAWIDPKVAENTTLAARQRILEDVEARAEHWREHRDTIAFCERAKEKVEAEIAGRKEYRRGIEWATREALAEAVKAAGLALRGDTADSPSDLNVEAAFTEIIDETAETILIDRLGERADQLGLRGDAGASIETISTDGAEEEDDFGPDEIPF